MWHPYQTAQYLHKFGEVDMGEESDAQNARQHTINFRAIASSWYK